MTIIISRAFPLIRRTFFFCLIWIGIFFLLELKVVSNNIVWQSSLTRFENQSESFNVTITNTSTKIVVVNGTTRVITKTNPATTTKPTLTTTTSKPTTTTTTTSRPTTITTKITIPTTTPTKSTSRPTTINSTTAKTTNKPTTVVNKIITTNIPTTVATNSSTTKPVCFFQANFSSPTNLVVNETAVTLKELSPLFPHIQKGGHWEPGHCVAGQKLGIFVPFRNRWNQLPIFLRHLHPLLVKQLRHYTFYVIEQADEAPFNRGKLLNAGVREALKLEPNLDCFILHDVDTLPETDLTMYKCHPDERTTIQMATYQKKRQYAEAYKGYTGGVFSIGRAQFEKINGFSNEFWGWGGEDDELGYRLQRRGIRIELEKSRGGYFSSLEHKGGPVNPDRMNILDKHRNPNTNVFAEGLNTAIYKLIGTEKNPLFTLFKVNTTATPDLTLTTQDPLIQRIREVLHDLEVAKRRNQTLSSVVKNKK